MAWVDGVLMPGYVLKSVIKLVLFLACPFVLSRMDKQIAFAELFRVQKNAIVRPILLGVGLYAVILCAYFLVRNVFDFSNIAGSLTQNVGVTKENFLFVAIYISFVNSLLEEFFFRGFVFTNLKTLYSRKFAHLFSAVVFALYHVAMMIGWFSLPMFLLCMAGLTAGGLIFNYLNEKQGNIYASWFVHMFANFAINTIGFMLL
ncbi:MAG: CPBP family intramembrane metalloprotease [Oscillospiraceae bacterium]|nr:CPBP family intramembrane metalloprotease [Oscillospiraceae bacterium]